MSAGIIGGMQIIVILVLIIGLLITIFYNLTLQKAMDAVSDRNRTITPGLIWLNLIPIPFLNSVWTMIFGIMTCSAINNDAGKKIAPITLSVVYPSLSILTSILAVVMNATSGYRGPDEAFLVIVGLFSLATFVLWIIFWVQIHSAKKKLEGMPISSVTDDNLDSGLISGHDVESSNSEKEKLQIIREYKELLNEGVITQEEFDKKKKELLR